ncbi:MAG: DUF393 domain-containing protein [Candidatus Colwellbacteria bacterium]|nr:DUF393 domain-containing protein [Candidatus Colwellbacteria bacterium]
MQPQYPLTIFYDGACAACSRLIAYYMRKDVEKRLIAVDISGQNFRADAYNLDAVKISQYMHVRDSLGNQVIGVEAFVWIWEACGYKVLPLLFRLPLIRYVAKLAYHLFARWRYAFGERSKTPICDEHCGRWKGM